MFWSFDVRSIRTQCLSFTPLAEMRLQSGVDIPPNAYLAIVEEICARVSLDAELNLASDGVWRDLSLMESLLLECVRRHLLRQGWVSLAGVFRLVVEMEHLPLVDHHDLRMETSRIRDELNAEERARLQAEQERERLERIARREAKEAAIRKRAEERANKPTPLFSPLEGS